MRYIVLAIAGVVFGLSTGMCDEGAPSRGLAVVYAVTEVTSDLQPTTIYAMEPASGEQRVIYEDQDAANRVLLTMASSDVRGAARAVPPEGIYVVMGPGVASDAAEHADALCRVAADAEAGKQGRAEQVLPLPLCFGQHSAYGMANRAPMFAASPDGSRFAVYALRVGDTPLERPTIRVLSVGGAEEWRIALEHNELYVSDMAFSPDGRLLAYSVLTQGDVHTLDERLLPKAGVFLADIEARTTRRLEAGFVSAVAWGPKPEQVTLAVREGDIWSTKHVGVVLQLASGEKVAEFSLRGAVTSLAYSPDGRWLAVQSYGGGSSQIRLYGASGGWGRTLDIEVGEGKRMALLGWGGSRSGTEAAAEVPSR